MAQTSFINYLKQRKTSFGFAFKGIATLVKTQPHARLHLLATLLVTVTGIVLKVNSQAWINIVFAMGMVWVSEAINTSIEFLTDLVSPNYHPLAGHAKDVAAAAVLISAIGAAIIGILTFYPYLIGYLMG